MDLPSMDTDVINGLCWYITSVVQCGRGLSWDSRGHTRKSALETNVNYRRQTVVGYGHNFLCVASIASQVPASCFTTDEYVPLLDVGCAICS